MMQNTIYILFIIATKNGTFKVSATFGMQRNAEVSFSSQMTTDKWHLLGHLGLLNFGDSKWLKVYSNEIKENILNYYYYFF